MNITVDRVADCQAGPAGQVTYLIRYVSTYENFVLIVVQASLLSPDNLVSG